MHTIEQALFKNLPEQNKSKKSAFNFKINAIDQWFDALPLANIRVSTKNIYKALKESNSQQVSYKKRLYFLEKLHEPVMDLTIHLKKLNLNRELPLDEKHQRIAILLRKLHSQVSIGYKFVLRDLMKCQFFIFCPGKSRLMAQVIVRIIRHHSLSLIASYQFYNSPYKGLWSDIHCLFLLAHQQKLLNKKVSDPSLQLITETTIKNVYLEILLISVADPYRMSQHHTYSIFRQLEEWSALADIHQHTDSDDKNSLMLDLSKDSHPTFITSPGKTNARFIWTLDTSKLDYAHLIEHFDSSESQTTEINADLLKQLSLSWGIVPNRQHNRRPAKSRLTVAIGLNNVHYVLNGHAEPEWLKQQISDNEFELSEHNQPGSHFSARTVESTVKVNDIWGEVFSGKTLLSGEKEPESLKANPEIKSNPNDPKEWDMINESIGGYCLLWDKGDSINAKVGEIIAICHEEEKKEGYWFVGTIRWIKCVDTHKMQIGVQIMAPNAIAVSTAKFSSMQEGIKSRAILLPAIPVLKQPKTLITTALGYDTRDQVILDEYRLVNANITNVKSKVVLTDTLEVSSHFSRFVYKQAEEFYGTSIKNSTLAQSKQESLSLDSDTEFDAIWDDL